MNERTGTLMLRWGIALLLLGVTLINYIDRTLMSDLIKEIRQGLSLTDNDYAHIVSFFLVAYAIMYACSGYIIDKVGTRIGMAAFVFLWSVSQMLHGLAGGKWSFGACRVGLGLAEPGSFPAAVKAIGEWFPARQRALGVGIFNVGSSLGAAAAPPIAAYFGLHYGWRSAFVFTGALGIVWIAAWLVIYKSPDKPGRADVTAGESAQADRDVSPAKASWCAVLLSRPGLMVILPRFLTDVVIYFVIFWLPDYLEKARGFDLKMIGQYAWMPFVYGGAPGYIIGGLLSNWLMSSGWTIGSSRKIAMTIGAAFLPAAIAAPFAPSAGWAIAAMCLVVFGHAIWISNLMALPADLFSPGAVATAAGLSGMGGAIGGALANWKTGWIVLHFSYMPIFICAGLLHPVAVMLVWLLLPERYFRSAG
ncbi:MAG TPA: MFS transporter [Verrucomicrobiae bacterium]|nr:MFS transporter [Verrucomicrobiae bacterium]